MGYAETMADVMRTGLRFISTDLQTWRAEGRMLCSAGITLGKAQYRHHDYWEHALVPRLPWRRPTDLEFDLLLQQPDEMAPGAWLQIITVPRDLIDRFAELRRASREGSSDALREYTNSAECRWSIDHAMDYARSLTWPTQKTLQHGSVFYRPAGLPTSTLYQDNMQRGLHIDTGYPVSVAKRKYSPNRLSINLGLCDRFLLFVNLGLEQIEAMLAEHRAAYQPLAESPDIRAISASFYQAFPGYPVVKVRLRPGEAYIAPTETMIHDGCTEGQTSYDVQFAVHGHFRPQISTVQRPSAGVSCVL